MLKKIFTILIILLLLSTFPNAKLKAESGLQISPAVKSLVLKPGDKYTGSFNIKNNNEFPTDLVITKGLKSTDNSVSIDNFRNASPDWINLDSNQVRINSLSEQVFNYSLNIPSNASEGFYSPMFIFKLTSSNNEIGATTSLTQSLPFQFDIYVSEGGVYNADLDIRELSVSKTVLVGSDQKVNFSVVNNNNSPSKPLIRFQIVSPDNDVVYQTVENESLAYVLKDNSFSKTLDVSSYFKPDTKFGRYSVELLVTDTLTSKTKVEKVYFWYIPQTAIIVIALISSLIFILIFFILRKKRDLNSGEKEEKHLFAYK